MALDRIAPVARRALHWSVVALGASIPVSTALDNVLLGVVLIAWALSGWIRDTIKIINKIKYLWFSLLLVALLALGTLVGITPLRDAVATLAKYADLLWIPIFVVAFRNPATRLRALHAFAIAIVVTVALSYGIRFGVIAPLPLFTGDATTPTVFKLKITHGILVAFGAFLFAWLGSTCGNRRLRWIWYASSLFAALNVLLMVQGATGYLTLGVLALLLGYERLGAKGLFSAFLGLAAVATVLAVTPTAFRERVTLIQQEIKQWRVEEASQTSTGLRLEFYRHSLDVIAAHPLVGVGTGGFAAAYARQVYGSGKVATQNPHNELLHLTAQLGMAGLMTLVALFWTQWRSAKQLAVPMERALMRALVLTMVAGCMVNSLLLDHAEGLFYAWLSGLLLAGLKYQPTATQTAMP